MAKRIAITGNVGDILCFEMEAAGIAIEFPCIIIRGVSDYADSYKNNAWQHYAAAAAAASAKELLSYVAPEQPFGSAAPASPSCGVPAGHSELVSQRTYAQGSNTISDVQSTESTVHAGNSFSEEALRLIAEITGQIPIARNEIRRVKADSKSVVGAGDTFGGVPAGGNDRASD